MTRAELIEQRATELRSNVRDAVGMLFEETTTAELCALTEHLLAGDDLAFAARARQLLAEKSALFAERAIDGQPQPQLQEDSL